MRGLKHFGTGAAAAALALGALSAPAFADTWTTANAGKITTQNSTTKVGVGLTGNASVRSFLDVEGNAIVGAGYSGNTGVTPPTNGLLVEGNMGVGTSSPVSGARLDVNGLLNVRSRMTLTGASGTSPTLSVLHTATTGNIAEFRSGTSPGNIVAEITTAGTGYFSALNVTNGNLDVRFNMSAEGNGSVGGDFYAGGRVTANEIHSNSKITVGTGSMAAPDYVFDEKKYKLMSLPEVERFVKKNRHLPEIPPGREIEAKGINVAEMNLLLLKKVEELTLHAIEQDKRIRELSARIR